ncbi:tyrosinase [Chaetomium sp. MPI-CAGE-AT-0009]|nr:tyrosinase [Chaetomium sp. MPI-CAGE-AT-0009]
MGDSQPTVPLPTGEVKDRKDITKLTDAEMDDLIYAFHAIQNLPTDKPNSFFQIAGLHGEPFRGAGYSNAQWWGGYCHHGNILFPTWHRAYVLRLEKALQSQVPGVMMAYWDELAASETGEPNDIPHIFLEETYTWRTDKYGSPNVSSIPNPLYSYRFQRTVGDTRASFPDADYTKPKGYQTVRFPYSGLVGPSDVSVQAATASHNALMDELNKLQAGTTDKLLNTNVKTWLTAPVYTTSNGKTHKASAREHYMQSLRAPNYTVYSNTTSAQRWNEEHGDDPRFTVVWPIESPHNAIHLAVGGIQVPGQDVSFVPGANGDMGENETASFDPIFFFHHCFIDRMFWWWQKRNKHETGLGEVIDGYPGTNSVDAQGPTPGIAGGTWLSLDTPLAPFKKGDLNIGPAKDASSLVNSKDVVNINDLGYMYSLPDPRLALPTLPPHPHLSVGGINRAAISGSFAVSAWAFSSNVSQPMLVGVVPVLSRWHTAGCANCQNHLEVRAHFPLVGYSKDEAEGTAFEVRVHTRDNPGGAPTQSGPRLMPRLKTGPMEQESAV